MATKRERDKREVRRTNAKEWAQKQEQGYEPTAVKLPEGMKLYKLEEGTHEIDIIPFRAGANNPNADEGMEHFEAEYAVYRIPRPDGNFDRYCALSHKRWGEADPVAQYRNKVSKEEADALRPQLRHLFLVNDKPGDPKNPLKVMDAVHYNRQLGFGEQLVTAINAMEDDDAPFYALEGGKTLRIKVADAKFGSVSRIDLVRRKHDYPESMLDKAPCLDDCILKPKGSVLKKALGLEEGSSRNGEDEDREAPDNKPYRSSAATAKKASREKPPKDDEEENDDPTAKEAGLEVGDRVMFQGEEFEIIKISKDGSSLTLEDDSGDEQTGIAPKEVKKLKASKPVEDDEDEDEDEDEEEETPKKKTVAKKSSKDDDDDDDWDD